MNKLLHPTNTKLKYALSAVFVLFIFSLLLYLNRKTPMLGDDYTYSLIFDTAQKLQSINDIIISQTTHYYIWGGRIVVHTISHLLLLADPLLADIINSLVFIALILLIYFHINYKRKLSLSLLIGAFLLIWFLEPFAETVIWITGSANYLWGTTLVLAFMLPYRMYENRKKHKTPTRVFQAAAMLLSGAIAGCTNENTGAGLLLMCALFIANYKKEKRRIPIWAYAGLLGATAGYIFMITAPGNTVRAQGTELNAFMIGYHIFRHTQALFNMLGLLNAVVVALAVYLYKTDKIKYRPVLRLWLIYVAGILVSIYAMTLAPFFPERAWFGIITFNVIAAGLLVVHIENPFFRQVKYGFVALGIMIFLFNLFDVYKDVNYVEQELEKREQLIRAGIEEHKDTIVVPFYHTRTKYALRDAEYASPLLSRYYGVAIEIEQ
ncbi:MAG: DUF6056 family protein [Prevotella sp.]|jgi:hypothetical protein|nr:DUF6056 family protein [Prevotella sp.]